MKQRCCRERFAKDGTWELHIPTSHSDCTCGQCVQAASALIHTNITARHDTRHTTLTGKNGIQFIARIPEIDSYSHNTGTMHRIRIDARCAAHKHTGADTQKHTKEMDIYLSTHAHLAIFFYFASEAAPFRCLLFILVKRYYSWCFFHLVLLHPAGQRNRISCAISTIHTATPFEVHATTNRCQRMKSGCGKSTLHLLKTFDTC